MKKQKQSRSVKKSTKFVAVAERDLVAVVGGHAGLAGKGKLLSLIGA